jgi:hypothetical protein
LHESLRRRRSRVCILSQNVRLHRIIGVGTQSSQWSLIDARPRRCGRDITVAEERSRCVRLLRSERCEDRRVSAYDLRSMIAGADEDHGGEHGVDVVLGMAEGHEQGSRQENGLVCRHCCSGCCGVDLVVLAHGCSAARAANNPLTSRQKKNVL